MENVVRNSFAGRIGSGKTTSVNNNLIPQNSKRRRKSQEGMNPAITSSKSKAELTSVNS